MAPPKRFHAGQSAYSARQKEISRQYRENNPDKLSYHDFMKLFYSTSTQGVKRSRQGEPVAGPSHSGDRENQGEPPATENTPNSGNTSQNENMPNPEAMDVVDAAADGMSQGAAGSRSMATQQQQGLWDIPRSIKSKPVYMTFKKSRLFYTYGYAFQQLTKVNRIGNVDKGDTVIYTTPLTILPNNTIGFYLDKHEINLISLMSSRCVEARVTVVPQGLRATFDTGTTLSGQATSEHVAFGCHAIGLNHKMYTRGCKYTASAEKPMIPTDITDVVLSDIMDKYYGRKFNKDERNIPMILGVPRHTDAYCALLTNSSRALGNYATHDEGCYKLDEYLHRWNFLPKCGEKVIDWEYKCKNGFLNIKAHDVPGYDGQNLAFLDRSMHANMSRVGIASQSKDGQVTVAPENEVMMSSTRTLLNSYSLIDDPMLFGVDSTVTPSGKTVPLIYFGLLPIPAINPSKEQTDFLNAAGNWSVTCELTIELDYGSTFAQGKASHAASDNVLLRPNDYSCATGINDFDVFAMQSVQSGGTSQVTGRDLNPERGNVPLSTNEITALTSAATTTLAAAEQAAAIKRDIQQLLDTKIEQVRRENQQLYQKKTPK